MSLEKRGKIWHYDFVVQGQRFRGSTGAESKTVARDVHDKLRLEAIAQLKQGKRPEHLWEDAAARWLAENSGKKSIETDKTRLRWLSPHLMGRPLTQIDNDLWWRIVEARRSQPAKRGGTTVVVSDSTLNRYRSAMIVVLNAAVTWGWLPACPYIHKFDEPEDRLVFFTREQIIQIIAELPLHMAYMTAYALLTGMRDANVHGLRWSQVREDLGIIIYPGSKLKGGRRLTVPITNDLSALLDMVRGNHDEYVFTYPDPKQGGAHRPILRASNSAWRRVCKKLGLRGEFRWHDTRHTWASWHTMSGTAPQALRDLGGWQSLEMVERYSALAPEHLRKQASQLRLGGSPHKIPTIDDDA